MLVFTKKSFEFIQITIAIRLSSFIGGYLNFRVVSFGPAGGIFSLDVKLAAQC